MFDFQLMHVFGCSKPAMLVRARLIFGSPVKPADWQNLDGEPLQANTVARCGSCGKAMSKRDFHSDFIVERTPRKGRIIVIGG